MSTIQEMTGNVTVTNLTNLYVGGFWQYVSDGQWVTDEATAIELRKFISTGYTVLSELRAAFDSVAWDAHDSGKLDKAKVDGIRNRSEFTNGKPGRKAKTLAEKLADKIR